MNSAKQGSSESSSEENNHRHSPEKSQDDNTGTGRSYECTFCKRGFTNAQALGGHMNIHRKDKAKAKVNKKQLQQQPPPPTVSSTNSRYTFAPIPTSVLGSQMNYQFYFPASTPSYPPHAYYIGGDDPHLGANLSLQIGTPCAEDRKGRNSRIENEVDLELRLGHDP